jgi:ataxia telangiectasia mutated family protein
VKLLYEGIFLKNELLTLIALDYAKTLKCILSFRPHLEHLKDDTWEDLVALAFNVVLGEPPRGQLDQDVDSASESGEATSTHTGKVEDEDEDDEDELPILKKKRKRATSRSGPSQVPGFKSKFKHGGSKATSVSLEQVEFASILSILLGYSGTPILVVERSYLPQSILHRMERFLMLYPADSSLLYDYLPTLSSVLDHLALNHVKDTQRFARNTWDILTGLWNTKDKSLREHLIVVIRVLMPYLTADFGLKSFRDSYDQAGALWKLYNTLEGETDNRRGVETLALDSLRLEINTDAAHEGMMEAFVAHTFRAGLNFDTRQAISWAVLQTQADCAAKVR